MAWRIARLMRLGWSYPDLNTQLVFEPDEWQVAYILNKKRPPENPVFPQVCPVQSDEFAALAVLLSACQRAGLTQSQVAELMGSSKLRWR